MLARLQQFTTLFLVSAAFAWAACFVERGQWFFAALGAATILLGYTAFLAAEFVILALTYDDDSAPRPKPGQLLKAWWGEVLTAPLVFCWRQPFCSRSEPDFLPDGYPERGVVLVHGFVCNRGLWNPWLAKLRDDRIPCIAINLEPVFGSIDSYTGVIEEAVARLERSTGLPPVIVAHSMGGLAVRAWLAMANNDDRVHHVITIGTPHRGTWLGRFGHTPNGKQMRIDSEWLRALASREPAQRYRRFTCIYSHCDNIVFPTGTATLPGANNHHVTATAHVSLAFEGVAFAELRRRLKPPSTPSIVSHQPVDKAPEAASRLGQGMLSR